MAGPIMDAAVLTYDGISFVPSESYLDYTEPAWILGKHFILEDGEKGKFVVYSNTAFLPPFV